MLPCVIFDIDGVLADARHRLHLIRQNSPDWEAFFARAADDSPIEPVVNLARALDQGGAIIVLVTGRPERIRSITEAWLHHYLVPWTYLLMRADGDRRPDTVVKMEAFHNLRINYCLDSKLAIEDRPSVVAMWRELGVCCLAADDSEWRKAGATYDGEKP